MLILFDIDATLLTTTRAGLISMAEAGQRLHGESFDIGQVEFAGRLDPLILSDALRRNGLEPTPHLLRAYRDAYVRCIEARLREPGLARTCPGVPELVAALESVPGLTLGLLTGNFAESGMMKLRAAGLDPDRFPIRAWGDDSPHDPPSRDHLPPVAMSRHAERCGSVIAPERVVVIGDTPHDVRCARVNGCRVLGVGTGMYPAARLLAEGADHAADTLEDTREVVRWLLEPLRASVA
ncbi:MAG: haloacid dehalogenase-like hydrolase [Phycisphaerales bacterium]|nr:haloacid dehalogenase-like hydrolase [Phycisphaerales bacterium]